MIFFQQYLEATAVLVDKENEMRRTDYFLLVFYKTGAIFEDGQCEI